MNEQVLDKKLKIQNCVAFTTLIKNTRINVASTVTDTNFYCEMVMALIINVVHALVLAI